MGPARWDVAWLNPRNTLLHNIAVDKPFGRGHESQNLGMLVGHPLWMGS